MQGKNRRKYQSDTAKFVLFLGIGLSVCTWSMVLVDFVVQGIVTWYTGSMAEATQASLFWKDTCEEFHRPHSNARGWFSSGQATQTIDNQAKLQLLQRIAPQQTGAREKTDDWNLPITPRVNVRIDPMKWTNLLNSDPEFYKFCVDRIHWLQYSDTLYGRWLAVTSRTVLGYALFLLSGWDPLSGSTLSINYVWTGGHTAGQPRSPLLESVSNLIRIVSEELLRMHLAIQTGAIVATFVVVVLFVRKTWLCVCDAYTSRLTSTAEDGQSWHNKRFRGNQKFGDDGYPMTDMKPTSRWDRYPGGPDEPYHLNRFNALNLRQRGATEPGGGMQHYHGPSWLLRPTQPGGDDTIDSFDQVTAAKYMAKLKSTYDGFQSRGEFMSVGNS